MPAFEKWIRVLTLALLLTSMGWSVIAGLYYALVSTEQASLDFQWDATRVLLHRQNPYELALTGQPPPFENALPDSFEPNQVPSALIILTPYALLPWHTAKVAWAMTNLTASIIIGVVLFALFVPDVPRTIKIGTIALWVVGYAWRLHVGLGQHTLWSLAFFLLSWMAIREKRILISALLFTFAFLKYTTIVPLSLFFLWQRQWKPVALAFGIHLVLHSVISLWLNENPLTLLLQPLLVSQRLTSQGSLDIVALTLTTGIVARMGLDGYQTTIGIILSSILMVITVGVGVQKRRRLVIDSANPDTGILYLALLAMVANVVVYHRLYDHVTLIVSLVAFIATLSAPISPSRLAVQVSLLMPFLLINFVHPLWSAQPPLLYLYFLIAMYYLSLVVIALFLLRSHPVYEPPAFTK